MAIKKKIRIIVVDDHPLYRMGLTSLLKEENGLTVIGELANGQELMNLLEKKVADIILMDLEMPVMNGYQALNIITEKYPGIKVIINSSHYSEYYVAQLLSAGARAYLSKDSIPNIIATIIAVFNDGYFISKAMSKLVVKDSIQEKRFRLLFEEIALTEREQEVLQLICNENTSKEISILLEISENTVEFHRKNIYKKTQLSSSVGLIKYAIKTGITNNDMSDSYKFK